LFFNSLRISALVGIGHAWSPDIAVMGFHSTAGWVELLLTLAGVLWVLNRFAFFNKELAQGMVREGDWPLARKTGIAGLKEGSKNTRRSLSRARRGLVAPGLSNQEVLFVPQIVLLIVSFLTQLFTGTFYWLYPVHGLAAIASIWVLRSRMSAWWDFSKVSVGGIGLAILAGLAVLAMWLWVIPHDPVKSREFSSALFSVSVWGSLAWVLWRIVGASIVVPIVEELAFRGYLLGAISRGMVAWNLSPKVARVLGLLLSSAAFGFLHSNLLAGFLAGLVYGLLYLRKESLQEAILAHAVTNFGLVLVVLSLEWWSYW
jgi:CAAX prenyl protease-like protein